MLSFMIILFLAAIMSILVIFLARELRILRVRRINNTKTPIAESPVSEAIVRLVAMAGGIYVALLVATEFLRLSVPPTVSLRGIDLDPLAAVAILLSFLQPVYLYAKRKVLG